MKQLVEVLFERASKPDLRHVPLARLESVARRLLPSSSPARTVILAEKDVLPAHETLPLNRAAFIHDCD